MFRLVARQRRGAGADAHAGRPEDDAAAPHATTTSSPRCATPWRRRIGAAVAAGVTRDRLCVDPGIGFGKNLDHNLALLHDIATFRRPPGAGDGGCLAQAIHRAADRRRTIPAERVEGTAGAVAWCAAHGVDIVRVHDVRQMARVVRGGRRHRAGRHDVIDAAAPVRDRPAGEMAYLDEGDGPAVVLLHGFPASSFLWREFLPLLAGRFRVIVPDLLGAGDSRASRSAPRCTSRAQAGRMFASCSHIWTSSGSPSWATASAAGVAQLLALDGDGVDAMVLLDCGRVRRVALRGRAEARHRRTMPGPADARAGGGGRSARCSTGVCGTVSGSPTPCSRSTCGPTGPRGRGRFARGAGGLDGAGLAGREAELGRIEFPVLILWGEDDPFFPADAGRAPQRGHAVLHPGAAPGMRPFPARGGPRDDRADDRRVPAGPLPHGTPRPRPEGRRRHAAARTSPTLGRPGRR